MRVTFLVNNYAPSIGGAQHLVQQVAEGLVHDHGHAVQVVTTDALRGVMSRDPGRVEAREETIGGVRVHRYPVAPRAVAASRLARRARLRRGGQTRLTVGPLGVRLLEAAWRAPRHSDAVVAVTVPSLFVPAAALGARRSAAAFTVMPLLHLGPSEPPEWAMAPLRRADGCTSCTAFERDWLAAHGVPVDRVAVLPPGCRPEQYPDTSPSAARAVLGLPERPTVGYVGRLAAHKGIETLFAAAGHIWQERPATTVLVAGSPAGWSGFDDLLAEARRVGGDRLVVRESFAEEERSTLLSACDVVAFPSREESFGMVTVEAWCARRAVVAGDIPAVRSLVRPGVDADLVPVGDDRALAQRIGALLDDPERRHRYGELGRARAESEFGWNRVVAGWDEFLQASVQRAAAVSPRPTRLPAGS